MRKAKKKFSKNKNNKIKDRAVSKTAKGRRTSASILVCEPDVEYQIRFKARANKAIDESWDFRKSNTKEYTHCFHPYPAMMIPQVARRIIEDYGSKARTLFDPYCGTGTSLVEANLKGINAIGTDINPLARLIASAKTTKLDIRVLDLFLHDFTDYVFSIGFGTENKKSIIIPQIKNS